MGRLRDGERVMERQRDGRVERQQIDGRIERQRDWEK